MIFEYNFVNLYKTNYVYMYVLGNREKTTSEI